jgi:hypothetical protein
MARQQRPKKRKPTRRYVIDDNPVWLDCYRRPLMILPSRPIIRFR